MLRIKGAIEGVAPILFSRMYGNIEGGPKADTSPEAKQKAREQEPLLRCHRDERGVFIPPDMFKQVVLAGGKAADVKNGRRNYATILEATLFCQGPLYLGRDAPDEVFEHWGRVPPGPRGAAVMLRYPLFRVGWQAAFDMILTTGNDATIQAIQRCIEGGGLLVGMGSWRPEYGRFILTAFGTESLNQGCLDNCPPLA